MEQAAGQDRACAPQAQLALLAEAPRLSASLGELFGSEEMMGVMGWDSSWTRGNLNPARSPSRRTYYAASMPGSYVDDVTHAWAAWRCGIFGLLEYTTQVNLS